MKTAIIVSCLLIALPAGAVIQGTSTVSNCGEGGNWIDITFTTDAGVRLVDAWWDFGPTGVWLDANGSSSCSMQNNGVSSFSFYFDVPAGTDTQDFGLTATGFDGGDYFRFIMDLDLGATGSPFTSDYYGATVRVEFSDGTTLAGTFNTPYDSPNGATANFTNEPVSQPNLAFSIKPGWYDALVARPADDATWTSVPAPTSLVGEAATTWLNGVCQNIGTATAMPSRLAFRLDGQQIHYSNLWTITPGSWNGPTNAGPFAVRGGRHTLRMTADVLDAIAESDESDNIFARQYSWTPITLAPLSTVTRAAPPLASADVEHLASYWWNCDGVRVTPAPAYAWCSVWCEREADDEGHNYALRLHPASDDPLVAFGSNIGGSRFGPDLQAVIINTHTLGTGAWDIGVQNHPGYAHDYRIAHLHESPYPFDFGIEPETPYFASRLMMFEFDVGAGDLGPATLTAYSDPDDGPVRLGWLTPGFTSGNLDDLLDVITTDASGCAKINLDLTETGYHCAVVFGNRAEHPGGLAVNVGLYGPRPDLAPAFLPGWCAPMVPRPAPDAVLFGCGLPDTLHGNAAATYMNVAYENEGTVAADILRYWMNVDGQHRLSSYNAWSPLGPGLPRANLNMQEQGSPWFFKGGRHTVSFELDYLDELTESVERNNLAGRQYCWSPRVVPAGQVTVREGPPAPQGGWDQCDSGAALYENCDGLRILPEANGNEGRWRGLAAMASYTYANVDLTLHEPLEGAENGFGPSPLAASAEAAGMTDFVLVNDNEAARVPYDIGVVDDGAPNGGYAAMAAVSTWGGSNPVGERGPFTMAAGGILALHEFQFDAGTLLVSLDDLGTDVDWGLSIYGPGSFHGRADALVDGIAWSAAAGGSETIFVDVPTAGLYCIAVWKTGPTELLKPGTYRLWFAPGVSDAGDPTADLPTASRLVGAAPNPFNPRTSISFDLVKGGRCEVTLHDLQGRMVRTLVTAVLPPGRHETVWDGLDAQGRRAASGVYVARLQAADRTDLLKVTLVK